MQLKKKRCYINRKSVPMLSKSRIAWDFKVFHCCQISDCSVSYQHSRETSWPHHLCFSHHSAIITTIKAVTQSCWMTYKTRQLHSAHKDILICITSPGTETHSCVDASAMVGTSVVLEHPISSWAAAHCLSAEWVPGIHYPNTTWTIGTLTSLVVASAHWYHHKANF